MIGRLGRPHGLNGYLGLYVDESDLEYFQPGKTVFVGGEAFSVESMRRADRGHHLKLAGVDTREAADEIRGTDVTTPERRTLGPDEYWPEDLVGLQVCTTEGEALGRVVSLVTGGAQDRIVVDVSGDTYEIPFVSELVPRVDVEGGYVEVLAIPGLIEP